MFFQKRRLSKPRDQPVSVLSDRIPPDPRRLQKNQRLIHFFSNLPFNMTNPHELPSGTVTGVEPFNDGIFTQSETLQSTPCDYFLANPDKKKPGLLTLYEWLGQIFSKEEWESGRHRDTLVRALTAILLEGDPKKVALVNRFIQKVEPYRKKDHSNKTQIEKESELHFQWIRAIFYRILGGFEKDVDDFTTCMWTRLYYLSKRYPEKIPLTQEAKSHLLHQLMRIEGSAYEDTIEKTGEPIRTFALLAGFPVTTKGILNSENHLLMINSSAYLKNQLMDPKMNAGSELESGLCSHLDRIYEHGLTEFNSIPYAGYTLDALFNLHDFADEPVKSRATRVLDKIFYDYAIHTTHDGKSFRPFSRQAVKIKNRSFMVDDAVRACMITLLGLDTRYYCQRGTSRNAMFSFVSMLSTYRLPKIVANLAQRNEHGVLGLNGLPHGNAEVSYKRAFESRNKENCVVQREYLLSGGGVSMVPFSTDYVLSSTASRPGHPDTAKMRKTQKAAEVISRNPVLILDGGEGPFELKDAFYLGTSRAISGGKEEKWGPGIDSREKNNTGIYYDTMVGPYPVHIPEQYRGKAIKPQSSDEVSKHWSLYEVAPGLRVAVFDGVVPTQASADGNITEVRQLGIIMVLPGDFSDSQMLINTIAYENKSTCATHRLHIANTIRFPNDCKSVMRGKTVHFDAYAPLDRYAITGAMGEFWSEKSRIFSKSTIRDGRGDIPGWSAMSVIQSHPGEHPRCFLDCHQSSSYEFLMIQSLQNTTSLAELQSYLLAKMKRSLSEKCQIFLDEGIDGNGVHANMLSLIRSLLTEVESFSAITAQNKEVSIVAYEKFKQAITILLNDDERAKKARLPNTVLYPFHCAIVAIFRAFFRIWDVLLTAMSNRIQGKEEPYIYQSRASFFKFPENSTQKDMFHLKKEFDVLIEKLDETYTPDLSTMLALSS